MTKICCISDTHDLLDYIDLPDADLLVHAGDISMMGTVEQILKFNEDCGRIEHKFKYGIVFIAGNHDWLFQKNNLLARSLITNATYLEDSHVTINGLKIYGAPWQPTFYNWAFNLDRGLPIKAKWDLIPDDVDVLITHGPPYGILDVVGPNRFNPVALHVGCEELAKRIEQIPNLKLHVSGHLHNSHGFQKIGDKVFISASSLNDHYRVANRPIILDL